MAEEHNTLLFAERVNLLLEQKYRLLDTLSIANHRLDEKADRAIQTGSIMLGLLAIASALPTLWPIEVHVSRHVSMLLALVQVLLVFVGVGAFVAIIFTALKITQTMTSKSAGGADWNTATTTYLSENSFDYILSDLLAAISAAKEQNDAKGKQIDRIRMFLKVELVTLTIALLITWLNNSL